MSRQIVIDLETRSTADLKRVGVHLYAADPTTSVTTVGWKNGDDTQVWQPPLGDIPNELFDALADERVTLVAHNASFERLVLSSPAGQSLGLPDTLAALDRWDCTAARGAQMGLPRDLHGICHALRLPVQKDAEGHSLMLRVSRPRTVKPLTWWEDTARMTRLADYCRRDVEAEAELNRVLPPLTDQERKVWLATERLNDRGVAVDPTLLRQLIDISVAARLDLDKQMAALTGGVVPRVSNHAALTRWLISQGLEIEGSAKSILQDLVESAELTAAVQAVLDIRMAGGGSSAQKAAAIARRLSEDGRIRGALIYGGAAATLRWSSHGAQLQNLPRHDPRFNTDWIMRDLAAGASLAEIQELHGPPLKVVSELLRPVLIAADPESVLIAADFAQIEARVLAWLAGQDDSLAVFIAYDAKLGPDPYRVTAGRIYHAPPSEVTAAQRQIGKVATLALGFGGGAKAFKSMAKNFGLKIPTEQAEEIKAAWRAAHPHIAFFWNQLDAAMRECLIQPPGETFAVGRVEFRRDKHALTMRLPSGRRLVYWQPSLKEAETPWGELRIQPHYWAQDALTRRWIEFKAYGGLLCENATQAAARDILADALVRLDAAGLNPILTVHDEVLCETSAANVGLVERVMLTTPAWADGLPVAVDVGAASRYQKG